MKPIVRTIEKQISESLTSNKVLLLYGTRRVGKTYLVRTIIEKLPNQPIVLNGEDMSVQESFKKRTIANYQNMIGDAPLLIIDEAQAIPEIGKSLKLMIDAHPQLTILATGSSSLELANTSGEPLTGRQIPFYLYPIAQQELNQNHLEARQHLEERLIYGSYPEIFQISTAEKKAAYLQQLVQSYLLKDILSYSGIRHSEKIYALLRLIAFQTGSEVSYQELSNQLGISKITVENYLDLLSKVFILFKLPAYTTNQRNEVTKTSKWYFYDNGVRNAVVNDFRIPAMRQDIGQLWESYMISERIKKLRYDGSLTQFYFWRNYQQQEIDLIEYDNGTLRAFEIKYNSRKKVKTPSSFRISYPDTEVQLIEKENYLEWLES